MFQKEKREKVLESDDKEWFVIIENQQEGPFSLLELKRNSHFTPDTLVWKKGFQEWVKARFVLEMQNLFKDDPKLPVIQPSDQVEEVESDLGQESQLTLTLQQDPYQIILWILLLLLILIYTFYQIENIP